MPDLKRIEDMENCLNECGEAVSSLREQLGRLNALREKAVRLYAYYGSEDWYADREKELPEGFRAGVLSEDAVYDSMTELRETAFLMLETGTDILKNWI
ncbi:MAG: DUF4298 domain-containing protein [Clostridia bacterium]|nr:DUF4298 domain-containing protein [Clostridia bacterium]